MQFATGRDLALVPQQRTGPVDKFMFPLAELAGRREDGDCHSSNSERRMFNETLLAT
jgi:hypothetical protein